MLRTEQQKRLTKAPTLSGNLCPTLCDPTDSSLPGSAIHEIFQARILEWVAISFSNIRGRAGKLLGGIQWLLGRFSGDGNGNPLQCSCLENPMDGGAR